MYFPGGVAGRMPSSMDRAVENRRPNHDDKPSPRSPVVRSGCGVMWDVHAVTLRQHVHQLHVGANARNAASSNARRSINK